MRPHSVMIRCLVGLLIITGPAANLVGQEGDQATLPNTSPLTMVGEIDRTLIAGVSKFLDRELAASVTGRQRYWHLDATSPEDYSQSLAEHRQRLAHILGVRDARPKNPQMELLATTERLAMVGKGRGFNIYAVRWRSFADVYGEGLLLTPHNETLAHVVAIPDADQTPEQLAGLMKGIPLQSQSARILAENQCQVLIPMLVSRKRGQFEWSGRRVDVTNREFLYRSAFELGRHLIGYEVQKILAGVDWFQQKQDAKPLAVVGWGEGGLLAICASALDDRIDTTCVSGYFEPLETVWQQPIDRNVFALLDRFGDAELAAMIAPRGLIVEAAAGPEVTLSGGQGAPGRLQTPELRSVRHEFARAQSLVASVRPAADWKLIVSGERGDGPYFDTATRNALLQALKIPISPSAGSDRAPVHLRNDFHPDKRLLRQMRELDRHSQYLLRESPFVRKHYMRDLKTDSLESFTNNLPEYRQRFAQDVIGQFDMDLLPPNARTRKAYSNEHWTGYEVVLDVFPDVIAHGLLLLPNDLKPTERRPVVVCQHGLEGRPQDTIGEEGHHAYKAFAARLAERGFITFAPQNLYRHRDEFRVLQRKANPLGKTLFSIITPQHQQIINWLQAQPFVDGKRIGFYGLSYGGKTAMRVPALLTDYCLSICSADFNEWVDKNASTRNPRSYVWSGEYEIFEFDLGSTFNYAEMAALIAPRPFMVERGHDDGVADDETVAYEFAKVRRLYTKLGVGDRCEIEWFNGPHTINGQGTYAFLHKHLDWPEPR